MTRSVAGRQGEGREMGAGERGGGSIRTVVWRRLDPASLERCTLRVEDGGWVLAGTVVLVDAGRPLEVRYTVSGEATWATRRVDIAINDGSGGGSRGLRLDADGSRRWSLNGGEVPVVAGCHDVDLGVTPATNTLPIRRLAMAVGGSADLTAAWVRFPELTVEPLDQRYVRLADRRYRYESRRGSETVYAAELDVDDLGLVERYGDVWQRVAVVDGGRPRHG